MWGSLSLFLLLLPHLSYAFYLPGAAPRDYKINELVDVQVNALTPKTNSATPKLKSLIDYDYYNPKFHFCQPEGGPRQQPEGLGSIIFGDRLFNSPIRIPMLTNNSLCEPLCTETISGEDAAFINERIREDYVQRWLVDGLPAATVKQDTRTEEEFYDVGFDLGTIASLPQGIEQEDEDEEATGPPVFNNLYNIILQYHTSDDIHHRVVGVIVHAMSDSSTSDDCGASSPLILREDRNNTVKFKYRVTWERSNTRWATRWDAYLHIFDPRIHWFNLITALLLAGFLCVMVSMILWRNVSRDISRYNAMDLSEDVQEDFGWKLVHGEVFRSPRFPMLLSVLAGNGAQIMLMLGVTLVFALFGFLSPSNRGSLAGVMLVFWTLFGSVGGYVSCRVYLSLDGQGVAKNTFMAATLLPSIVFAILFLLNLVLVLAGSSGALPFGTMVVIVLLWFGISAPLSFVGARYGRKHGPISHPVRVNRIPRQIPPPPTYLKPWNAALMAGVLPFGVAFVELFFIIQSLFASRAYYAFGFLAMIYLIVNLTTATITILFTYFILCAEEYRWHWRSFLIGGGSAFWVFGYGVFYYLAKLSLSSMTSVIIYFGYLLLLSIFVFLLTGTIGFVSSYWALRRLYSSIRID